MMGGEKLDLSEYIKRAAEQLGSQNQTNDTNNTNTTINLGSGRPSNYGYNGTGRPTNEGYEVKQDGKIINE